MKSTIAWLGVGLALAGAAQAQDAPAPEPAVPALPTETPSGPFVEAMLRTQEKVRGVLRVDPSDPDGFLLYLDGGNTPVRFLWKELVEEDARRLRRRAGIQVEARPEEQPAFYKVRGLRVTAEDGRVLEGIEEPTLSDGDRLVLKTAEGRIPVVRDRIRRQEETDLPLVQVYTPREIRDLLLQRHPAQDARDLQVVADVLIQQGLRAEALDLLKIVEILRRPELPQNRFYADLQRIQNRLATTEAKVAALEVGRRVLDERYEEALGLLRQIEDPNRDEDLMQDLQRLRGALEALRERRLEDRLIDEGYTLVRTLLTARATDRSVSFAEAVAYADRELTGEIMNRLAAQYRLDRGSVERIWARRPHQRTFRATYGEGSWIDRVPTAGNPESWWAGADSTARYGYLEARYAEKSLRVVRSSEAKCPECGGHGTLQRSSSTLPVGGQCPACRGAKVDRVVYYN
jgi:hypothetical protein